MLRDHHLAEVLEIERDLVKRVINNTPSNLGFDGHKNPRNY